MSSPVPPTPPVHPSTFASTANDLVAELGLAETVAPVPQNTAPGVPDVPGFRFEGELGRGGMGVVYKAHEIRLNRMVALKMVLAGRGADPAELLRFLNEAEANAAIDHPNVVRVYEAGQHAGQPYFTMEYLDGGSLAQHLKTAGKLAPEDAAKLVEQIARGVQAAHALGIVHRDLKPGNVLFAGVGRQESGVRSRETGVSQTETPDGGSSLTPDSRLLTPKVSDFGLAKRLSSDMTRTGAVLGTPAYMAPEQASGKAKIAGPAADVYALGVILYECLTGTVPFTGQDAYSVIRQVMDDEPEAVRTRAAGVPRDLELICLKCLNKDPERRYATAGLLADDLKAYLAGEPISARPQSLGGVLRLWTRQNFGSAGWTVAGGVLIGLICGGYASVESLGTKLDKVGAAYDALPRVPRPWSAVGTISEKTMVLFEAALVVSIPLVALGMIALARPRNRSADAAVGVVSGFVAAVVFFLSGFGWWSVYQHAVKPTVADMELLRGAEGDLLARYPDLAKLTPDERRDVLNRKAEFDLAMRIPVGLLIGVVLCTAVTVPLCVAMACSAGGHYRRHGRARQFVVRFLEVSVPAMVFGVYAFVLLQRAVLNGVPAEHPWVQAGMLGFCALVIFAAVRRWPAGVRGVLFAGLVAYYTVTNYREMYEFR